MLRWSYVLVLAGCRFGFSERGAGPAEDAAAADATIIPRTWEYRRSVDIDITMVAGAQDLVDFPLLVRVTDPDVRSAADGGTVRDARGYDVLFAGDDPTTPLAFEIERYVAVTGELIAWVRVPALSPVQTPKIFLYTGSSEIVASLEQRADVWRASFAGVWHMNEPVWTGATDEVVDSTGRSHGTAIGANTTAGKIGSGGTFGATDINIDVGSDATLLSPSLTVAAWANPQSVGTAPDRHPYMVRQDYWRASGSDPRGYYMEIYRTQSDPRPTFYTGNSTQFAHAFATTNVVNGTWYHVVGTRDATSGVTRIYVNGVEEGNATMTGGIAYLGNSVFLGGYEFETWDGLLDEVRISGVARSADWIRTEYNNQGSPETYVTLGALEPL